RLFAADEIGGLGEPLIIKTVKHTLRFFDGRQGESYTRMSLLTIVAVIAAGSVAGALGSLLGIGGGVFLVPFLNAGLGLDFKVAAATGLMTVIATSSVVSAGRAGHGLINLRLGMLLEIATTIGGLLAAYTVAYLSNHTLNVIFAVVTAAITALMLTRLERRNVLDPAAD